MDKYNLRYEERDIAGISDAHAKATQISGERPSLYVEIDGKGLNNASGEVVEKYLLEKGLVKSVDRNPKEISFADEEQEVIRSKTIRFF